MHTNFTALNDIIEIDSNDQQRRTKLIKRELLSRMDEFFFLVYQPQMCIHTKKIISCEVLSRGYSTELNTISPYEFLPIIEELELHSEFDLLIFKKMCIDYKRLSEHLKNFSINISLKTLNNTRVVQKLVDLITKFGISPMNITLEVIEGAAERISSLISKNINLLKSVGFNISLDDFGTGYSSYYRLTNLEFTEVKIPREFLLNKNTRLQLILNGMTQLFKSLNSSVVMEGVESEEDYQLAKEVRVDIVQGYFLAKPMKITNFISFVNNFNGEYYV